VREISGRVDTVDSVICTERNSRHVERECNGGVGIRGGGIRVCGRVFVELEERVWRRRERVDESSGIEEVGTRRKKGLA